MNPCGSWFSPGGIGGAKFLVGVRAHARAIGADVTAVVNVGDDGAGCTACRSAPISTA